MKYLTMAILVLACGMFVGCGSEDEHAGHDHDHDGHDHGIEAPTPVPTSQPAAAAVNSKCPITGNAVNANGTTVTFNGKEYGLCCDDCIKAFNTDPAKYVAVLAQ